MKGATPSSFLARHRRLVRVELQWFDTWCFGTTNHKGSEILRALFIDRIPRATRGYGNQCCGWCLAETSGVDRFPDQDCLFSLFGLRVCADGGLAKSTAHVFWFVVNHDHRSDIKSIGCSLVLWESRGIAICQGNSWLLLVCVTRLLRGPTPMIRYHRTISLEDSVEAGNGLTISGRQ